MTFHWPQITKLACFAVFAVATVVLKRCVERAGVNPVSREGCAFMWCGMAMTIAGIILGANCG